MSQQNKSAAGYLAADVADAGTFVVAYPNKVSPESGVTNEGDFYGANGHKLIINDNSVLNFPEDFDVTLGTASITITNKSGSTWATGSQFYLQLDEKGKDVYERDGRARMAREVRADTVLVKLGAPDAAVANGVSASQGVGAGANFVLDGALVSGGVAVFDVPRNVVAAWTTASTLTITGVDEYGNAVVEQSANGTSHAGKKAFKKITSVKSSAAITAATVGTGDVLGLPVFVPGAGNLLKEMQDRAVATAGTLVAGVITAGGATATSGDVRGTYDPNAACDGDKVFELILALTEPGYKGAKQYAGAAL